jgi:hypothetical protein
MYIDKKLQVPVQTTGPRKIIPEKEIGVGGKCLIWGIHASRLPEATYGVKFFLKFFKNHLIVAGQYGRKFHETGSNTGRDGPSHRLGRGLRR